ncbi:MAG: hypothetical protein ACM3QZ_03205 [Solirubrobacterales bacterium]
MDKREQLMEQLRKLAVNGRLTCTDARKLAEELKVSNQEVGAACDALKIKICACELGCF